MKKIKKRKSFSSQLTQKGRHYCYHTDCGRIAPIEHSCRTCEELAAKAKIRVDEILSVRCCHFHNETGLQKLKRHALTAHPFNLLRATAAALKGDEVF